jgi:selenide,water dikinase
MEPSIKLTQYSRGAGCGCKIAPGVLQEILHTDTPPFEDPHLIIGGEHNEDAAVYELDASNAIISTTDFFMPIVDDAFQFGKIAAANAISDVYAMGGEPLMALAILGWPIEKLDASIAKQVLEGGRSICKEAGIILAGGHSIDCTEPVFGLSVTGKISKNNIKRNHTAQQGDLLFLTKPIGLGILSTAQKRGLISEADEKEMLLHMTKLNSIGKQLGCIDEVSAMTDVTGFGLLGHCMEMAKGSGLGIELFYHAIPVVQGAQQYLQQRIVPDATYRNWNSYSHETAFEKGVNVMEAFNLLPDPQTNGGLLFSISESDADKAMACLLSNGLQDHIQPIGRLTERREKTIVVNH